MIYQNKNGANKGIPKETLVLTVKNLLSYITKLANSESIDLDLSSGELPVCIDADAGAPSPSWMEIQPLQSRPGWKSDRLVGNPSKQFFQKN